MNTLFGGLGPVVDKAAANKKKIIKIIVILVVISVILFIIYRKRPKRYILLDTPFHLETDFVKEVPPEKMPESVSGVQYSYSFWLYIGNVPENAHWKSKFNNKKFILYKYGSPNVVYHPDSNKLTVGTAYKSEYGLFERYYHDVENLPIQKWMHFGVTLDNRYFDLYINGELTHSKYLDNVGFIFQKFLFIGEKDNNFNGYITDLEYFNYTLNPKQIKKIYDKQVKTMDPNIEMYNRTYFKKKMEKLKEKEKEEKLNKKKSFYF